MKVTINNETPQEVTYPRLVISKTCEGLILWQLSEKVAVCISPGQSKNWKIGEYYNGLSNIDHLIPFTGSVTLSNE